MASIVGRILSEVSGMGSPDMWTEYHNKMENEESKEALIKASALFVIESQNVKHQLNQED